MNSEEDSESESEEDSDSEGEDVSEEEESDKEDDREPVRPYMALLQGFNDTSAPSSKRRKLDHQPKTSTQGAANSKSEVAEDAEDLDEEPAEESDDGVEEQPDENDSEDEQDATDPFDLHFSHPDEQNSSKRVKAAKAGEWSTTRAMVQPWRATFQDPGSQTVADAPSPAADLGSFNLKQKLKETAAKKVGKFGDVEKSLGPLLFNYRDVFHSGRTVRNAQSMRRLVCLHALNHVFK